MNCLAVPEEEHQQVDTEGALLALAFGLGWAAADEAHLPALPEAVVRVMGVSAARIAVTRWNGTVVMEHAFPSAQERGEESPLLLYEVEENLGAECTLRLSVESAQELVPGQTELLKKIL